MWSKRIGDHKILDIENFFKKPRIFREKSVDKTDLGLLYYSSTSSEDIPAERTLPPRQKISERG